MDRPGVRGASTTVATSGATGRTAVQTKSSRSGRHAGTVVSAGSPWFVLAQPVGVPGAEGVDLVLRRQVRAGHVVRVADPAVGPRDVHPVLLVGLAPHGGEGVEVVVAALDGIGVHQPRRAHHGAVRGRQAARRTSPHDRSSRAARRSVARAG